MTNKRLKKKWPKSKWLKELHKRLNLLKGKEIKREFNQEDQWIDK